MKLLVGLLVGGLSLMATAGECDSHLGSQAKEPLRIESLNFYLAFRGVLGGRIVDGKPTVFVTTKEIAQLLPQSTYDGRAVDIVVVQRFLIPPTGEYISTVAEARKIKAELSKHLEGQPGFQDWIRGIGIRGSEGKFELLVRVSDPTATEFVPSEFMGRRVAVELGAIAVTMPQLEISKRRAEATRLRAVETFKSLRYFKDIVLVKTDGQGFGPKRIYKGAVGYYLKIIFSREVEDSQIPNSFEGILLEY